MKKKIFLILLASAMAMPIIGYSVENTTINSNQAIKKEKKPLYWIDTMEPDVHYSAPGKSRMGMDLVPVYTKENNK